MTVFFCIFTENSFALVCFLKFSLNSFSLFCKDWLFKSSPLLLLRFCFIFHLTFLIDSGQFWCFRCKDHLPNWHFQVLSPISDKSQEQSSEQGDSAKTPKISPTDHILACCGANLTNAEDENAGDDTNTTYTKLNLLNFNNNNYNQCNSSSHNANNNNNNLSESEPSPAPFSMPKLQRRLREQQQLDRRREYNNSAGAAHGSDSGISMASQDVLDIYELLQVHKRRYLKSKTCLS